MKEVCLSSLLHHAAPAQLHAAGTTATLQTSTVIDDFSHGLRDWYQLNAGNLTHQETWTRKVTDPMYRAPEGSLLRLTVKMPKTNRFTLVLRSNDWRSYRGPRASYHCTREIPGSAEAQTLSLNLSDFTTPTGEPLKTWSQIDELGLCAQAPGTPAKDAKPWQGGAMELVRVEWE